MTTSQRSARLLGNRNERKFRYKESSEPSSAAADVLRSHVHGDCDAIARASGGRWSGSIIRRWMDPDYPKQSPIERCVSFLRAVGSVCGDDAASALLDWVAAQLGYRIERVAGVPGDAEPSHGLLAEYSRASGELLAIVSEGVESAADYESYRIAEDDMSELLTRMGRAVLLEHRTAERMLRGRR